MFLYGCSSSNEDTTNTIVKEAGEVEVENGELELMVDVNVRNNQAEFIITVTNNSNEMKKLEFPTSQKFEIIIRDENQQEVYRYSAGKMFTQAIEYALIKPDESMQWEEIWEIKESKPGNYEAEVSILAHDTDKLVKTKSFQIPE
jgi:hypothetical protein